MIPRLHRSVLITGCSSGIGLCAARGLHSRGYRVFATARREQDVERLNAEGLESLVLDLDQPESVSAALEQVLGRTGGRLYALFNNGAYGQPGAVEDLTRDVLRAQFETNLFGWHDLTRRVIPVMRQQHEGRIIQNSSVLGRTAMAYRGAYNASKFALEGLTDTLRQELHGSGISISLIEPGPIASRFRANALQKWQANIDPEHSFHAAQYEAIQARLDQEGSAAPFTLPPEAVLKKVIHALESPRPKIRYPVTLPTYVFAYLRRILPDALMDRILRIASGSGAR